MRRYDPPLVAVAVMLAAIAGFVDALVFSSIGFFASFMSGNSTRLGVGIGVGPRDHALIAGSMISAFVGGVVLSSVVGRVFERRREVAVMVTVLILLLTAAIGQDHIPESVVLVLAAMAMGCENGVFSPHGEVTIGVTYMTGSLVKLGQGLASALMGGDDRWGWVRYLCLWAGFVTGAATGANAFMRIGLGALWTAALLVAAATIVVAIVVSRRERAAAQAA